MFDSALSPWVKILSSIINRLGFKYAAALLYGLFLIAAVILSGVYYYIALGEVKLLDIFAVVFFTAIVSPLAIVMILQSIIQLRHSHQYLKTATEQEKHLNQTLQDNIRLLNVEIEERKMAFHAKHRAIEELRKEITERKKTQQELAQQGMLLRSIVDSSPDLFYYRDQSGVFAGCNKKFEQVIGKSAEQLIGKKAEEIYPPQYLPEVLRTDQQVEQKQQAISLDVDYPIGNEMRWFEMRKVPFFNEEGQYIGLLAFGRDITSRKRAEQDLAAAFKDKGKFIATLSHELRTPLNGIVGLSRRLLDTELNQQQRSWCNTVFSSAETLGHIFNDIIDLDKIDREQLDIVEEPTQLNEFIDDVVNFGSLLAEQKQLAFTVKRTGDLDVFASVDPTRLRQVLWNLINNAVKFTQQGSIELSCCRQSSPQGEQLIISVTDSGIGMETPQLKHIFDMYYKAPDINGSNAIGSGIGLAVTKALVTAMQGQINVSSTFGQGSRFEVVLPLTLSQAPAQQTAFCTRKLTILLVEDVPLNADIAISLLEQRGHEVIWAQTGEDALSLVATEDDLDLVLLDMQLPDINGDEVAREIRQDSYFDALPIVALTANVRSAEQELAGINIQGSLAKPVNTKKLDRLLHDLFNIEKPVASNTPPTLNKPPAQPDASVDFSHQLHLETINDFVAAMGLNAFTRSSDLFAKLAPQYQSQLDASCQTQTDEYQSVAHKLKGAAGAVGLLQVQQQAKKMEDNCQQVDAKTRQQWLDELSTSIKKGQSALNSYLSTLTG